MRKILSVLPALLIFLSLGLGYSAPARGETEYTDSASQDDMYLLSAEELDDLLAPIALYPDPLIAQILPAATFIDQITEAADFVRRHGSSSSIDQQSWDVSVKAVAHYPDVLFMMSDKLDWTASLGQAFIDQQQDVMDAIQRLRGEASAQGNLYSTAEQQVIYEDEIVRIVPARPEYVYVPVYDPQVIYVERYNPVYPFITFGAGFTIGAWLNRDCDWRQRRVYYHGWRGDGWVHRARPHVHDRRGVYINRRASVVQVNNRVLMHDNRRYRMELRNDAWRRRGLEPPPPRVIRQRSVFIDQRPARLEQPRGRVERQAPARIERQGSGRGERQGPSRIERQAPGGTDRSGPGRGGRSGPGAGDRRPRSELQQAPAAGGQKAPTAVAQPPTAPVQPPAAVAQPPAPVAKPPTTVVQPSPAAPQRPGRRGRHETRPRDGDVIQRPERGQGHGRMVVPARPAVPPTTRPALPPTTRPALPTGTRPAIAPATRPALPPTTAPAIPTTTRPAIPPTMSPAIPPTTRPAIPAATRPAIPPTTRPAIPPTVRPAIPPTVRPAIPPTTRPAIPPTASPAIAPMAPSAITPVAPPTVAPAPQRGGRMERSSSPRFGGESPAERPAGPGRR